MTDVLTDISQPTHSHTQSLSDCLSLSPSVCPTQNAAHDIPGVQIIRHLCFVNNTLFSPRRTRTPQGLLSYLFSINFFHSKMPIKLSCLHSHTHSSRVNVPPRGHSSLTLDLSQDSSLLPASGLHFMLHNCPQLSFISHTHRQT